MQPAQGFGHQWAFFGSSPFARESEEVGLCNQPLPRRTARRGGRRPVRPGDNRDAAAGVHRSHGVPLGAAAAAPCAPGTTGTPQPASTAPTA